MSYKFEINEIHELFKFKMLIVNGKIIDGHIKTDTTAYLLGNEKMTYLVKGIILGEKEMKNGTLSLTLELNSETKSFIKKGSILINKNK